MEIKLLDTRGVVTCGVLASVATIAPISAQGKKAPKTIVLGNENFRVDLIVRPTQLMPIYGPRFDNTAMVRQVAVQGKTYLAPYGLTDEFGIDGTGVLGFSEAPAGGNFLKIGVGKLVKTERSGYEFWTPYKIHTLLPVRAEQARNRLTVFQKGTLRHRYSYAYRKRYRVVPKTNSLSIEYRIENTGKATFSFKQYNHNWFSFEGRPIAAPYHVTTNFPVSKLKRPDWLKITEAGKRTRIDITNTITQGVFFESRVGALATHNQFRVGYGLNGQHGLYGQQVEVSGDFDLHKFGLYTEKQALCPEAFVLMSLAPGESRTWTRYYHFSNS